MDRTQTEKWKVPEAHAPKGGGCPPDDHATAQRKVGKIGDNHGEILMY